VIADQVADDVCLGIDGRRRSRGAAREYSIHNSFEDVKNIAERAADTDEVGQLLAKIGAKYGSEGGITNYSHLGFNFTGHHGQQEDTS